MTAVDITGKVSVNDIVRIGRARRVSADNYLNASVGTEASTYTLTIVVTPSTSADHSATLTCDYSST